jgi:hypothetical protein
LLKEKEILGKDKGEKELLGGQILATNNYSLSVYGFIFKEQFNGYCFYL